MILLKMARTLTFTIEHDRLFYGPFPVHELNELDGLTVIAKPITTFKDLIIITVLNDEDTPAAIFVIGMYTQNLINKFNQVIISN